MTWTAQQKQTVLACYLGWTLDAFDFFLMVFILKDIAKDFGTDIEAVSWATMLTLAARPLGALIFGRLADRYGRKPVLMANIVLYSVLGFVSAFSPNLMVLLMLRTLFGVAMGGEWGVGSSLTMESIPPKSRGLVSGLLQAGYPSGYLLATLAFGQLFTHIGWRGMFMLSLLPALLTIYIRLNVPESPTWEAEKEKAKPGLLATFQSQWRLSVYAIVLMMCFNFFAHGTQDMYPTFLRVQHKFDPHTVQAIGLWLNIGAIAGGLTVGWLSERIGRRNAISLSALFALPIIPLWAFSHTPLQLAAGAFFMQVAVQGAWGVIPAYLNEISPSAVRATFPGLVYQLGNLLASINSPMQAHMSKTNGGNYGLSMAIVAGTVAIAIAILIRFGRERRGEAMHESAS
ncbi:MAG: MFS transporter [Paludibacterium sp.]|uniref:MFS transporter n=1 Tax=Paludibacterium sp. TaxID=1917523 RepID=UPI0025EC4294|nr:MFS transporter [Paludibacterium sp.]MBV8046169.1 MFS transporter [Paludibacterium sp.]MBV8648846.1 MFS transporter [Paludibacterium sp.]